MPRQRLVCFKLHLKTLYCTGAACALELLLHETGMSECRSGTLPVMVCGFKFVLPSRGQRVWQRTIALLIGPSLLSRRLPQSPRALQVAQGLPVAHDVALFRIAFTVVSLKAPLERTIMYLRLHKTTSKNDLPRHALCRRQL